LRSGRIRTLLLLALPLAVGGVLRVVAMEATFPPALVGDERYYVTVAANIARGRGHEVNEKRRAFRPPGQAWLLSRFVHIEGPLAAIDVRAFLRPLLRLEVVLGTLLVAATMALTGLLFRELRPALVAGWIAALYPTFVAYSHYLWSETLFALLVTAALCGVVAVERRRSFALAAATGVLFGLSSLTRDVGIPVAGVCALWWPWTAAPAGRRRAAAQAALMLAVAAAIVLPWTVRNYRVLGRFVPVSTVGWYSAAAGNAFEAPDWLAPPSEARFGYKQEYWQLHDEVAQLDFARRRTFELIREEQPSWLGKKLLRNAPLLYEPDSFLFYKILLGGYGRPSPVVVRALVVLTVASYCAILVGGVLGMATAPGRGRRSLGWWVLGVVTALHVLTIANTRHRMPFEPLLIAYAGYAAVAGRRLLADLRGGAAVAASSALLFFLAVCLPYFARYGTAVALWKGQILPAP
jgi:hypothetical protein